MIKSASTLNKNYNSTNISPNDFNQFFVDQISYDSTSSKAVLDQNHSCAIKKSAKDFRFNQVSPATIVLFVKRLKSSRSEDFFGY